MRISAIIAHKEAETIKDGFSSYDAGLGTHVVIVGADVVFTGVDV